MSGCSYAACTLPAVSSADGWAFCFEHAGSEESERAAGVTGPRPTVEPPARGPITELPVRVLAEHPDNVRGDLGDLTDMVATVRAQGILQPLLVTHGEPRGTYVVIAGHRRLAAALEVGLVRVPVLLRPRLIGTDAVEAMLVENLHRALLNPVDEAIAYQQLLAAGRTQREISEAVGKSQGHISQRLALLNLTPPELEAVRRKEITIDAGYRAGRDRSERRRPHDTHRPKPRRVPHFNREHPLATTVAALCGHEVTLKLGVACGPCWEKAIRADASAAASAERMAS